MLRPALHVLIASDGSVPHSGGPTPIDILRHWFIPECTVVQVVHDRRAVDGARAHLQQLVAEWGLSPESRRLVVESSHVARGLALAAQRGPCDLVITHNPVSRPHRRGGFASVRGDLLTHVSAPLWSWNAAIPFPDHAPTIAAVADWSAAPAPALRAAAAIARRTCGKLQIACRMSAVDDSLIADGQQDHIPTNLDTAATALDALGLTSLATPVLSALGTGARALHRWCRDTHPAVLVVPTVNALTWRRQFDEALHEQTSMVLCLDNRSAASPLVTGLLAEVSRLHEPCR